MGGLAGGGLYLNLNLHLNDAVTETFNGSILLRFVQQFPSLSLL